MGRFGDTLQTKIRKYTTKPRASAPQNQVPPSASPIPHQAANYSMRGKTAALWYLTFTAEDLSGSGKLEPNGRSADSLMKKQHVNETHKGKSASKSKKRDSSAGKKLIASVIVVQQHPCGGLAKK